MKCCAVIMSTKEILIYTVILCTFVTAEVVHNFYRGMEIPRLTPSKLMHDKYFKQKLDHFRPADPRAWFQRYWENATNYEKGGPAFILISGEAPASTYWMSFGAWHTYAKDVRAMMFMLEHRFYGASRPTNDTSTENLTYLSSAQALADLSHFITAMNQKYNFTEETKWIAIGGSYAGSLAVWLRMKYPHLIHGAVSSSAPLLAKLDFPEFLQTTAKIISMHDHKCGRHITRAFKELEVMQRSELGRPQLTKWLQLCENFTGNASDVSFLHQSLANNIANLVQNDKGPRGKSDIYSVKGLCDVMTNSTFWKNKTTSLRRFLEANKLILNLTSIENCLPSSYEAYVNLALRDTDWDLTSIYGKQWLYQTCTEFGYFQTSIKRGNMFGRFLPLDFFVKTCEDVFGPKVTVNSTINSTNRTNVAYGAKNNKVSRIVYVHGSVDPWYSLGIYGSSGRDDNKVVFIKGSSHCADMFEPTENDSVDLKGAREIIRKEINSWIRENGNHINKVK